MTSVFDLPADVHCEIFIYLQDADFAVIGHVCKQFNNMTKSYQINGLNVINQAVLYGSIQLIKWLIDAGYPRDKDITVTATILGNLNLLKWMFSMGYPRRLCRILECAEKNGHTHIMDWLISEKLCQITVTMPLFECKLPTLKWYHEHGISISAYSWHTKMDFETMQWLHSRGISLSQLQFPMYLQWIPVENVKWLIQAGYLVGNSTEMIHAANGNNWDVVDMYIGLEVPVHSRIITAALKTGDLKLVEYYAGKCTMADCEFIAAAAQSGNIEAVEWVIAKYPKILDNIQEWCNIALQSAVVSRCPDVLDKIIELDKSIKFMCDADILYYCASKQSDVFMMDTLIARGIMPSAQMYGGRIRQYLKSIAILDWLHAAGVVFVFTGDFWITTDNSVSNKDILKWFYRHGYTELSGIIRTAIFNNDVPLLKWAHANKLYTPDDDSALYSFEAAKWMHSFGLPIPFTCLSRSILMCDIEALEWIYNNHYHLFDDLLEKSYKQIHPFGDPRGGRCQYDQLFAWITTKGLSADVFRAVLQP